MLWAIAVPLVMFTLPNIRVYDGERLFGVVFPLWAGLAGLGAAELAARVRGWTAAVVLAVVLGGPLYAMVVLDPFGLSYFNAMTGGLAGADGWVLSGRTGWKG